MVSTISRKGVTLHQQIHSIIVDITFTQDQANALYSFVYSAMPRGIMELFDMRGLSEESLEERMSKNPHWKYHSRKDVSAMLESVDKNLKESMDVLDEVSPWGVDYIIFLDEKDNRTEEQMDLRPNGFTECTYVRDFPIRNHRSYLEVRRRRWLTPEGKSIVLDLLPLTAKGSRFTEDFALFLKQGYSTLD